MAAGAGDMEAGAAGKPAELRAFGRIIKAHRRFKIQNPYPCQNILAGERERGGNEPLSQGAKPQIKSRRRRRRPSLQGRQ